MLSTSPKRIGSHKTVNRDGLRMGIAQELIRPFLMRSKCALVLVKHWMVSVSGWLQREKFQVPNSRFQAAIWNLELGTWNFPRLSSAMPCILALDEGTTSARAIVFD